MSRRPSKTRKRSRSRIDDDDRTEPRGFVGFFIGTFADLLEAVFFAFVDSDEND